MIRKKHTNVDDGEKNNHEVNGLPFLRDINPGVKLNMVRKGGFEPPRLSAPPPQDGVSASSTTSANPGTRSSLMNGH
jgi:hypothetical protein